MVAILLVTHEYVTYEYDTEWGYGKSYHFSDQAEDVVLAVEDGGLGVRGMIIANGQLVIVNGQ